VPPPAPTPSVKPEASIDRLVFKKTLERKQDVRDASDLGSDFFTLGQFISNLPADVARALANPIEGSDPDDGVVLLKQTSKFSKNSVMKSVVVDEEVRRLPNITRLGSFILVRVRYQDI